VCWQWKIKLIAPALCPFGSISDNPNLESSAARDMGGSGSDEKDPHLVWGVTRGSEKASRRRYQNPGFKGDKAEGSSVPIRRTSKSQEAG
jgi:hypothetical protein